MDTKAYRATRGIWTITTVLLVAACGPTDDKSITGIDDTGTDDTTPPTVASVSPSDGQSSVAVGSSVRVSFSETMSSASFNASSFILSDGMAGSVSSSGQSAVFAPSGGLEYATTYTATVRGTVTDAAGNALGSDHSWSFTTEAAPAPPFSMALSAGRGWVYDVSWSRTTVGSSIGVRTTGFDGTAIVVAAGEEQIGGRTAWRLLRYDIASSGSEPLSRDVLHLSEDAEGLSTWVSTSSGGGWRRVLSTQAASFTNNHFLMAGDPRGPTTTMSVAQVTVPAGSYTT